MKIIKMLDFEFYGFLRRPLRRMFKCRCLRDDDIPTAEVADSAHLRSLTHLHLQSKT